MLTCEVFNHILQYCQRHSALVPFTGSLPLPLSQPFEPSSMQAVHCDGGLIKLIFNPWHYNHDRKALYLNLSSRNTNYSLFYLDLSRAHMHAITAPPLPTNQSCKKKHLEGRSLEVHTVLWSLQNFYNICKSKLIERPYYLC